MHKLQTPVFTLAAPTLKRLMCASVRTIAAAHHGRFDPALATAQPLLPGADGAALQALGKAVPALRDDSRFHRIWAHSDAPAKALARLDAVVEQGLLPGRAAVRSPVERGLRVGAGRGGGGGR